MTTPAPTLDLSGLSPADMAAVTAYAEQLRAAHTTPTDPPATPRHRRPGETHEQWLARYKAWQATLVSRNPNMDDSRDSIYD